MLLRLSCGGMGTAVCITPFGSTSFPQTIRVCLLLAAMTLAVLDGIPFYLTLSTPLLPSCLVVRTSSAPVISGATLGL